MVASSRGRENEMGKGGPGWRGRDKKGETLWICSPGKIS